MSLSTIASTIGRSPTDNDTEAADIIEFIEADWGLAMKLFPVQKIILKAHYGIPLNDIDKNVPVSD